MGILHDSCRINTFIRLKLFCVFKIKMDLIEREVQEETEDEHQDGPTETELEDFKAKVSEYLKLDDQVRKLNIAIRERRVHLRALSEKIQDFMNRYEIGTLNTQHGERIHHKVRQSKVPIKIVDVKELLLEKRHLTGEQLFKELFESERPTKEVKTIRRVIPKVSLNLDI